MTLHMRWSSIPNTAKSGSVDRASVCFTTACDVVLRAVCTIGTADLDGGWATSMFVSPIVGTPREAHG